MFPVAEEFQGVVHATALLDRVMDPGLRQALLGLIRSLLLPTAAQGGEDPQAVAAAKLNGIAFVEAGGVQLMVDLLAGQPSSLQRFVGIPGLYPAARGGVNLQRWKKNEGLVSTQSLNATSWRWGGRFWRLDGKWG